MAKKDCCENKKMNRVLERSKFKCAYCDNICDDGDTVNSKKQPICFTCYFGKTDRNNDLYDHPKK